MDALREAHDYRVSPSKFLGLPWAEWGETDRLLALARRSHEARLCRCGCGQWAPLAHDDETDGWWTVHDDTVCYAGAALERWQRDRDEVEPGQMVAVSLDPEFRSGRR